MRQLFDLPYPESSQQKPAPKRQEERLQEHDVKIGRRYRTDRLRARVVGGGSSRRRGGLSQSDSSGAKKSLFLNMAGILILAAGLCSGFLIFMKGYATAFIPCLIICLVLLYLNN